MAESPLVETKLDAVIDGNHDGILRMHVSSGNLHVGDDPFRPFAARETDEPILGRDDSIPERQHQDIEPLVTRFERRRHGRAALSLDQQPPVQLSAPDRPPGPVGPVDPRRPAEGLGVGWTSDPDYLTSDLDHWLPCYLYNRDETPILDGSYPASAQIDSQRRIIVDY